MMNMKWKMVLVGTVVAGLGMTACVDDQPSVLMKGSIVGEVEGDSLTCTYTLDFDNQEVYYSKGYVDLASLATIGQPFYGGDQIGGELNNFYFKAIFINQLVDSRSVGSQGGGGGGGGFENLPLDQNDIQITSATVNFPSDANSFNFSSGAASLEDVERERLFTSLVASGEGVAVTSIPLIAGETEVEFFDTFLRENNVSERPLTFVAEIQLHGETMSGNPVESNIYQYPIEICADCGGTSQPICLQTAGEEEEEEPEEEE